MSRKKKNEVKFVECPICGLQTFNRVGRCKCGYEFPYDPIQDEIVVDVCTNCREIRQYKQGYHVGGGCTICPLCQNGRLVTLCALDRWLKKPEDKKQEFISAVEHESLHNTSCVPKCPTCGSANVKKISLSKKAFGGAMFGVYSSNVWNTMECKNCGAKW